MSSLCPNCRQALPTVGAPCPEIGCQRRGYHGVPADCVTDRLDPRVGLLLGDKYLLVRLLGKGGMGVVMVALQQPLLREVALKVVSGVRIDDTMRARFVREARAVAALDHPNIVRLIDFGVAQLDEEAPYMVMELVSGAESLRTVLAGWRQQPPTWKSLDNVFGQLLGALDAAHDRGIVHRDIKPDNVMCKRTKGYDWFVKVLDFGLAKSFDHSGAGDADMPSLTDTGAIVGTPQYMAPEQLSRAHLGSTDERADLYAVGVMLFELLLGRRAYTETDTMQLVFAKFDSERDPLRNSPDLDAFGPVAVVVRKAMAWAAADRFASASAFREAMATAVAEMGPGLHVSMAGGQKPSLVDLTAQTEDAPRPIPAAKATRIRVDARSSEATTETTGETVLVDETLADETVGTPGTTALADRSADPPVLPRPRRFAVAAAAVMLAVAVLAAWLRLREAPPVAAPAAIASVPVAGAVPAIVPVAVPLSVSTPPEPTPTAPVTVGSPPAPAAAVPPEIDAVPQRSGPTRVVRPPADSRANKRHHGTRAPKAEPGLDIHRE